MGDLGFDIENEFLPSFDKFQNEANKRLMFLKFFNQETSCDMRFSKEELKSCKNQSLFEIFEKKIRSNLQFDSYVYAPIKKINFEATRKVDDFFKKIKCETTLKSFSLKNSLEKSNIDLALKLIDVLEECNYSFYLDGEKIFKNFVTNKIIRANVSKEVYVNQDSLDIKTASDFSNTKIFTFWKLLDSNNLQIDEHIKKAVECIETTEFKQVYLVYPKNEKFNRHIKIKCDDVTCDEYEIKLVPYSLRSTLR